MRAYECVLLDSAAEQVQAAGVAARALRDNPVAMAISADPLLRLEMPYSFFHSQMADTSSVTAAARLGHYVLAAAGAAPPGKCVGSMIAEEMRSMSAPLEGASDEDRLVYSGCVMASNDLPEPHWHVGPVGVEPGLQSMGIGKRVMEVLCNELDRRSGVGWLETDKPENVRFYAGLGFELVQEAPMLAAKFWFMRRDPR
ncbi:MAG: GNAT family N-acetyltransferase [Acidimicrobiales bacterium]